MAGYPCSRGLATPKHTLAALVKLGGSGKHKLERERDEEHRGEAAKEGVGGYD